VCHCHWGVYLWVQHSDAGEVEESGGVDTSGGGLYNVHLWSRNCAMEVKINALFEIVTRTGLNPITQ